MPGNTGRRAVLCPGVNPAGLAFYKTGDFVVSPAFLFLSNPFSGYCDGSVCQTKTLFYIPGSGCLMGGELKLNAMAAGKGLPCYTYTCLESGLHPDKS